MRQKAAQPINNFYKGTLNFNDEDNFEIKVLNRPVFKYIKQFCLSIVALLGINYELGAFDNYVKTLQGELPAGEPPAGVSPFAVFDANMHNISMDFIVRLLG